DDQQFNQREGASPRAARRPGWIRISPHVLSLFLTENLLPRGARRGAVVLNPLIESPTGRNVWLPEGHRSLIGQSRYPPPPCPAASKCRRSARLCTERCSCVRPGSGRKG